MYIFGRVHKAFYFRNEIFQTQTFKNSKVLKDCLYATTSLCFINPNVFPLQRNKTPFLSHIALVVLVVVVSVDFLPNRLEI
jgi:hypothetical protein